MRSCGRPQESGTTGYWKLPISVRRSERVLRRSKALILLTFLAPRPGLEPGTYGLTGGRSICPLARMDPRFQGVSLPILLVRFTPETPGKGRFGTTGYWTRRSDGLHAGRWASATRSRGLRRLSARWARDPQRRRSHTSSPTLAVSRRNPKRNDEREGRGALSRAPNPSWRTEKRGIG